MIRGLKSLGEAASSRDVWLDLLVQKLDSENRQLWAQKTTDDEFPSLDSFIKFSNSRCEYNNERADYFFSCLLPGLSVTDPIAQNATFDWVVSGKMKIKDDNVHQVKSYRITLSCENSIDQSFHTELPCPVKTALINPLNVLGNLMK
ncbi:hypothetical protein NPIL_262191 [Nephila pilipes]|uniref:Uncharacterized protein n=1 Tax=Nephila pilipes TaxID=299642 RepID=A0A8X6UVH3_NEPPI|nr:hypothetical protein NPIL_262191 [Nephila pilipes]